MDESATATLTDERARTTFRRGFWQRYVTDVRRDTDAASAAYRATTPARESDRKMIVVLLTTAVALTCSNFLRDGSQPGWIVAPLRDIGFHAAANNINTALQTSPHAEFWQLVFWALVSVACYVVFPVFAIRVLLRERVRDYGLRWKGLFGHGRVYIACYLAVLPFLVAVSFGSAFVHRYPFYNLGPHEGFWPYLWIWWGCYALQFVALEFFFRGFVLYGLAPRFGFAAVFVMMVPYNMIHYGKPMPEALAAIVGALVLGTLSLKTKSIWWGAALHISIAGTMDLLALWHRGLL
jgi:membrane protease YdiL (CAAX protease family)